MRGTLIIARAAEQLAARLARAAAWLVFLAVIIVVVTVVGAGLGWNQIASWGFNIPLLGDRLTLTGMGELQWHIFAVLVMFGGLQALDEDRHVRVDFIYQRFSRRRKMAVNLIGHLILLLPFLLILIERSLPSLQLAWVSGAGSDYGGLQDRWIVKAALPVGFTIIAFLAICQSIEMAVRLASPSLDAEFEGYD
jgi:TRAP-type mannitol/chloroaromatic compound transport system permease small subunit